MSAKVTGWVLENSPVVGAARLVLLVLADRADHEGRNAYPSVGSIAEYARCGRSTVHRALRDLEADGHIIREGVSASQTICYRVVMAPEGCPNPGPLGVQDQDPGGSQIGTVPNRDPSHLVPERGPKSGPKPTAEPSIDDSLRSSVELVFDTWMKSTGRDPNRTKLTPDRRRRIKIALASHGEDMCLAAVRNIAADSWAAGHNDRGRAFNDIKHALGTAERIERWAAGPPSGKRSGRNGQPMATSVTRGAEVLRRAMEGGPR